MITSGGTKSSKSKSSDDRAKRLALRSEEERKAKATGSNRRASSARPGVTSVDKNDERSKRDSSRSLKPGASAVSKNDERSKRETRKGQSSGADADRHAKAMAKVSNPKSTSPGVVQQGPDANTSKSSADRRNKERTKGRRTAAPGVKLEEEIVQEI